MQHSADHLGLLRGLDAVLNRLGEALRTVEDRLRFDRGLAVLPGEWRALRERLRQLRGAVEARAGGPLALWRDVASDSGAAMTERPGPVRADGDDVLAANMARAREAARSAEEALRAFAPQLAAAAEALRYGVYAAESLTQGLLRRRARVEGVRLYVLLTASLSARSVTETARAAIAGGAQMLQLREKELCARDFLASARALREITGECDVPLIINDRVDVAVLCGADGVHQGQEDLSPAEARRVLGARALVGVSTHSAEQAAAAAAAGADYLGVGPIYATRTKEHRAAAGVDYIQAALAAAAGVPGFAIGGITRDTLPAVLAAGAQRIAVCTAIIGSNDIEGSARWFRTQIDAAVEATEE